MFKRDAIFISKTKYDKKLKGDIEEMEKTKNLF
jgi:hypothetical protein